MLNDNEISNDSEDSQNLQIIDDFQSSYDGSS